MRILVAGGCGYVGSKLCPTLADLGYTVDVIDLCWFGNPFNNDSRINVVNKNLFDCKETDLQGYDQVIFLAGMSNDPMAEFAPSENFVYNAALPSYLAFIAKKAGVKRYVYASSCSVYGYTWDKLYTEEDPVTCGYPYGISKLQGERGVMQQCDTKFSVVCLRKGTISGYAPKMRLDLIVNTMYKFARSLKKVTVNNPAIWRPILSINDAVSAYTRAVQAHQSISGVFNISSGNYTVGEVAEIVADMLPGTSLDIHNKQDMRNYKVTCKKAREVLSFRPRNTVADIVNELLEHEENFKIFDNMMYYNIQVIRELPEFQNASK